MAPIDATTVFFSLSFVISRCISWDGPTAPPGESILTTTALTSSLSPRSLSSWFISVESAITPRSSTTATLSPVIAPEAKTPTTMDSTITIMKTAPAAARMFFRTPPPISGGTFSGRSGVLPYLPDGEAYLVVLGVDVQDLDLDYVAFLDIRSALLAAGELGYVHQAFEPFLELDERAEVGNARYPALYYHAGFVALLDALPRVLLKELGRKGEPPVGALYVEDDSLDFLTLLEKLGGVLYLPPREIRDMDKPVEARLYLDERAVIGDIDDIAPGPRAGRVLAADLYPWVFHGLLDAKRDLVLFLVELQDHDIYAVAYLQHLRGMSDLAPREF